MILEKTEKRGYGKWSVLGKELESIVRENNKKPSFQRKSLSDIFRDFSKENNTTVNSSQYYYYTYIKPLLEKEESMSTDERIELHAMQNKSLDKRDELRKYYKVGDVIEVTVKSVQDFGAFVVTHLGHEGLIHISEISNEYVELPEDFFFVGEKVKAKLQKITNDGKLGLSTKALGGKEKIINHSQDISENKTIEIKTTTSNNTSNERNVNADTDNIIKFIKQHSGNNISNKALSDIEDMVSKYGVFETTIALIETIKELDISSTITSMTKNRIKDGQL